MSFRSAIDNSIAQEAQKKHTRYRKYASGHPPTFRVSLGGSTAERKVPIKPWIGTSTDGVKLAHAAARKLKKPSGTRRRRRTDENEPGGSNCKMLALLRKIGQSSADRCETTPKAASRQDDVLSIQCARYSIGSILHEACVVFSSVDGSSKLPQQKQQTSFFVKREQQPSLRQCGL